MALRQSLKYYGLVLAELFLDRVYYKLQQGGKSYGMRSALSLLAAKWLSTVCNGGMKVSMNRNGSAKCQAVKLDIDILCHASERKLLSNEGSSNMECQKARLVPESKLIYIYM